MSACIGIIGMGWVGSSVAVSTLQRGLAADLLLNDVRGEIAEGEAMDLEHGSLFYPVDARVRATSVEERWTCSRKSWLTPRVCLSSA
jgi:L-lactate dehydrogenase